jgi:hypothetical protein
MQLCPSPLLAHAFLCPLIVPTSVFKLSGADLGAPLFGHPTRSHRLRRTPIHRGLRLAPSPLHYISSLSSAYYLLFPHVFSRSWCGERTLSVLPSHQVSSSVILLLSHAYTSVLPSHQIDLIVTGYGPCLSVTSKHTRLTSYQSHISSHIPSSHAHQNEQRRQQWTHRAPKAQRRWHQQQLWRMGNQILSETR